VVRRETRVWLKSKLKLFRTSLKKTSVVSGGNIFGNCD